MDKEWLRLTAYRTKPSDVCLAPAPIGRDWMDGTPQRFAHRCLPLLIANQAGWHILSPQKVDLWWSGGGAMSDLHVKQLAGPEPCMAHSHFGSGILTWSFPFLFQTPPGYNLLARGPANCPKDGISPLEGIIETDWASATFTMNWKMTRPMTRISFEIGEPICFIVPQRRGELELFDPVVRDLAEEPELKAHHETWAASRKQFNDAVKTPEMLGQQIWQKHYFSGRHVEDGGTFPEHQTKLALRPFRNDGAG
jgi:hypothetical protein